MRYPQEQFFLAYKHLSDKDRDILMSEQLTEKIISICKTNGLSDETEGKIADEVGYVITKLEPMEKLMENLNTFCGVQLNVAQNIANEVTQFINSPHVKQEVVETDTHRSSEIASAVISQFGLEGEEQELVVKEVASLEDGSNDIQGLRKHLVDSGIFSYDQALKIVTAIKQLNEGSQPSPHRLGSEIPLQQPARPTPQPPKNLPTQENVMLRQTETPTYKLPDHSQMPEQHTHTPTEPKATNPFPQPTSSQTIVDQKLSGIVKLPKEEVKIDLDAIEQKRKSEYKGADPYREPIE